MKWGEDYRDRHTRETELIGNQKIVREFLWLPLSINGETRWLTYTSWLEEFGKYVDVDMPMAYRLGWCLVKWGDKMKTKRVTEDMPEKVLSPKKYHKVKTGKCAHCRMSLSNCGCGARLEEEVWEEE